MFSNLLALSGEGNGFGQLWPLLIIVVLMVGMMVLTIIPQRKRQKKAQEMLSAIKTGDRIKTIGGFVGEVTAIDTANNTLILNIGTNGQDVLVTIDKAAVYTVVNANAQTQVAAEPEVAKDPTPQTADDLEAESKAKSKKSKKDAPAITEVVDAEVDPPKADGDGDVAF